MVFCPDCGCQLNYTKGVILCSHCTYAECDCELCSIQDGLIEVKPFVKQGSSNNMKMKGGEKHVEQTN